MAGTDFKSIVQLLCMLTCLVLLFIFPIYGIEAPKPSRFSFFLWLLWLSPSLQPTIFFFIRTYFICIALFGEDFEAQLQMSKSSVYVKASYTISAAITIWNIGRLSCFHLWDAWKDMDFFDPAGSVDDAVAWICKFCCLTVFSLVPLYLMGKVGFFVYEMVHGMQMRIYNQKQLKRDDDLEYGERVSTTEKEISTMDLQPLISFSG